MAINFEADAQEKGTILPSDQAIRSLVDLVEEQAEVEAEIALLTDQLEEKNDRLRRISEVMIPDKLDEMGLSEIKLSDGRKVIVKSFYAGHISAEHQEQAFEWLREHELSDLIKHSVIVDLKRGEEATATTVAEFLAEQSIAYQDKESVHSQTLKSLIQERVESADAEFPRDLFGVYVGRKTTIKRGTK